MSTNGQPGGTPNNGQEVAVYDTIDYIYDAGSSGSLAANAQIRTTSDWDNIVGDESTASNEIMEVLRVEYLPPRNADGSIQEIDHVRLWDGDEIYPNLRYRAPYTGYQGPDSRFTTPPLGKSVLSGQNNPARDPIGTATPKYGTNTSVTPQVQNNGTQISNSGDDDASFRVRLHVYRWQGSESDLQSFFNQNYGQSTFNQNITMSNPFTGAQRTYQRADPIRISTSSDVSAHGQFTKLTGGTEQETPKVYPWATWADNANATSANTFYEFTTTNTRVSDSWKQLEFDFTDQQEAVRFDHVTVNQPDNLLEGQFEIDERDEDPIVQLTPNPAHQLPEARPLDGTEQPLDAGQVPPSVPDVVGKPQLIWDDGGGFRVKDNGTTIGANNILVGVIGKKMTLTS